MKRYKSEKEALKAAQIVVSKLENAIIDTGLYKGQYDCFFILHPITGREIWAGYWL